jgi:hypothetical protein
MLRGALLYDALMHLRFERVSSSGDGTWSLLCRLAANFRTEDNRQRGGMRSWNDIRDLRERTTRHIATVVARHVGGAGDPMRDAPQK